MPERENMGWVKKGGWVVNWGLVRRSAAYLEK